ncbi:MAG: type II/IV secretion system protein [Nitrospira sp.]|nr:type II/IV secretion system protein [Nitrospira sp.]
MNNKTNESILNILTKAGLLTESQVRDINSKEKIYRNKIYKSRETKGSSIPQGMKRQSDVSIIDIIEAMKLSTPDGGLHLSEDLIMRSIAEHFNYPFEKIDPVRLDSEIVTNIISKPYAIKHQLIPVRLSGSRLTIATSNPFEREGIDSIRQSNEYEIEIVISPMTDIMKIITEFYGFQHSISSAKNELSSAIDLGNLEQYVKLKSITELAANDQHIINAVEYLLHYAYAQRASDIHIEPKREQCLVRFRIDGVLHVIHKMPKAIFPALASRVKTLARMDIAEKRRPQDGRIKTVQNGKEIELRVSTLPVAFGEKIVMRIFDPGILMQDIEGLGFSETELSKFNSFIAAPYGLILVTGPTGSGKTTTLYSALKTLSTTDVNVTTIEDPVEMVYEDFNQISIQPQLGTTFASSLRTILRQDPDIIMVGEIRDYETAENAIQAALTGHLVLSTLHTNDAASTVTRLIDLGIKPFLINSVLTGVIAQRLVRRVCHHCAETFPLSEDECRMLDIAHEDASTVSIGAGCTQCRGTGYLGRTGIFEVMGISDTMKKAIEQNSTPDNIRQIALQDKMRTLRQGAIDKLLQGVTTVDELVRVTGVL